MSYSVHIIILNWHGLADTLDCLQAVFRQTYRNIKVHVIDNNSGNAEGDKIISEFPAVNLLAQAKNYGFCGGCNIGIRVALAEKADYLLFLNNDALIPDEFIEDLMKGAVAIKNFGAIGPAILESEKNLVWFGGTVWNERIGSFSYPKNGLAYSEISHLDPFTTHHPCGCCMLVPASVVNEVGLMNETYFAFYDEPEWCERMRAAGYESYMIPSLYIYHKVSRSTPSLVSTYLLNRNRLRWIQKYRPLSEKVRLLPRLLKEITWHLANYLGFPLKNSDKYNKSSSEVVLLAWRDFLLSRSGVWPPRVDRLIERQRESCI